MEQEIWKDVFGYEGTYQVSDFGRVRSLDRNVQRKRNNKTIDVHRKGRILRTVIGKGGMQLIFAKNGVNKLVKVHSLVLESFVGKRPLGYHACHFPDRSYFNNRLDNLRWDTPSNNEKDKIYHGTNNIGEKCGKAKITNEKAIKIKEMLLNNRIVDVSRNLNVSIGTVKAIKYGRSWSWLKV